eukprot:6448933-Amphidinium_carterae.1
MAQIDLKRRFSWKSKDTRKGSRQQEHLAIASESTAISNVTPQNSVTSAPWFNISKRLFVITIGTGSSQPLSYAIQGFAFIHA